MRRAEIRRAMKNEKKAKTATYNLTKAQLDALVREEIGHELERVRQQATDDAVNEVKAGRMMATVAQKPELMGETAILTAIRLIAGEEVEKSLPVEVELITK